MKTVHMQVNNRHLKPKPGGYFTISSSSFQAPFVKCPATSSTQTQTQMQTQTQTQTTSQQLGDTEETARDEKQLLKRSVWSKRSIIPILLSLMIVILSYF